MSDSTQEKKDEVSSLVVMACTLLSRLLGIVKAKVIAMVFGSGATGDVINFTYNIPNNFRKLFAEGAMSSAYVPVFSRQKEEGKKAEEERLMNLLFTYQAIIFLALVIFSFFQGEAIIRLFSDFGKEEVMLGGKLLPFFMLFLTFISLGTIFSSMLQVEHHFFASAFAPIVFSLTVIFGIILTHNQFGAMSMGYSVLLGGVFQFLFWYIALRRLGFRYRPRFAIKNSEFPLVLKHWILVTGSSFLTICSQQFSYSLASTLEEGSVTALSNATIFWQTPYGIFFTAITTVLFPLMSAQFFQGKQQELKETVSKGLQNLATFMIPSMILVFTLADECVFSILQSGGYTVHVAMMTSSVVRAFLLGMLFSAWYGFLQRFSYSIGRYTRTLMITVVQAGSDMLLSFIFVKAGCGIIALPIAGDISYVLGFIAMLLSNKDTYQLSKDKELFSVLFKLIIANIPLLIISLLYKHFSPQWWLSGSSMKNFGLTAIIGMAGVAVLYLSYKVMKIPFLTMIKRKKR